MPKISKERKILASRPPKERERFYLLPGQGGQAYRRKQRLILKWSVVAALGVSAIMASVLYWMNHSKH